MCLYLLQKTFNKDNIDPPKNCKKIDITKLSGELLRAFPNKDERIGRTYIDKKWKTTTFEEYMRFIDADCTDKGMYVSDYHDCDDYAIGLWGALKQSQHWSKLAFGLMFVHWEGRGNHAINFFVDNEYRVYYVEPQNDETWNIINKEEFYPYFYII